MGEEEEKKQTETEEKEEIKIEDISEKEKEELDLGIERLEPEKEPEQEDETKEESAEVKEQPKEEKEETEEIKKELGIKKEKNRIKEKKQEQKIKKEKREAPKVEIIPKEKSKIIKQIRNFYEKQYKKLLIIPILLLIIALIQIGIQTATTGEFVNKGVSLKGGVTINIPLEERVDIVSLGNSIKSDFPKNDIGVRRLESAGKQTGITIEADIDGTKKEEFDSFLSSVKKNIGIDIGDDYSVEVIGSSLGASFFRETIFALFLAFIFMGIVVFIYFRTFVPSLAVILAAFSDIVVTIAVINVLGIKIGTAGIAALLMLIGYSVDTDILLSTRVLKRKEGTEMDRIIGSVKTGMTMTLTTLIAVVFAYIFSQSEVLSQIMLIIIIGLCADIINTWIQNVGILRLYLEAKAKSGK